MFQKAASQFERFAREMQPIEGEIFLPDERLDPRTCLTCGLVPVMAEKHKSPADCIAELRNRNAILDLKLASVHRDALQGRTKGSAADPQADADTEKQPEG